MMDALKGNVVANPSEEVKSTDLVKRVSLLLVWNVHKVNEF